MAKRPRRAMRLAVAAAALGLARGQASGAQLSGLAHISSPLGAISSPLGAFGAEVGVAPLASAPTPAQLGPLVVGGVEFSWEDDIGNMEKLSNLFGQVFYTKIFTPGVAADEAWNGLASDIWALAEYAAQAPSLGLAVAMCLYNYFWWEGPWSDQPNLHAGSRAAELMYTAIVHARCNDPQLNAMDYFIQQCHLRWRYLMMLAGEVGRHFAIHKRDAAAAARALSHLQAYFQEMRRMPNSGVLHGTGPHEVNFNSDYYPAAAARQGPIWQNPLQDLPLASFLETHYVTIRRELDAILAVEGRFRALDEQTRNAETQFGPRGDDWLTVYLFRKGAANEETCAYAPRTCELLSTRPEVAGCKASGGGAGFLRMADGGRLKPHFGNAPRLSVHLGLIVPPEDIRMYVGNRMTRWEEGKVVVFDDTFVHQVFHNGVLPRYVLIGWICHPCDPDDGRILGQALPQYCEGPPGAMTRLGLRPLPPER